MADRVDVPALLRRLRQDAADSRCREARADMAYLDRLVDAVEHMRCRYTENEEENRADATRAALALLRGEVAP